MRQLLLRSIVLTAAVSATPLFAQTAVQPPATLPAAQAQATLPVKNVVLFSSGVGYFEHYGQVKGDGSTELRFKTNQINDILKSLVLQDLDGGKVSTVQYPSQDPVEKTLKSFQVDITQNPALADLLNQLRGARIRISVAGGAQDGTILGVEARQVPGAAGSNPTTVWYLNLIEGPMIKQHELSKISNVELFDKNLQSELEQALQALAKARDQDKKAVVVNFNGAGDRRIKLGYVVESPVWKTSYRLVVADKESNLQGWAIVENQTDNDWDSVQLSLVSGRPISFAMNLYQPLYIARPVVEMDLYQSLRPQTYDDGMALAKAGGGFGGGGGARAQRQRSSSAPAAMVAEVRDEEAAMPTPLDATSSVQSIASAAKLGELFQYTVGNVSLPRQKSAMIPIVTDKVDVEKLSIYNEQVLAKYPLIGAMVTNTTDKHLLQGPITVFEAGSYAGDAKIDNIPPGQKRLLSYGIDLQMPVQSKREGTQQLVTGKIVKGVLEITQKISQAQTFEVENKSDRDKTIILEHPIVSNWKLVNTPDVFEKTDTLYRFRVPVAKGKKESFKATQETTQMQEIAMIDADITAVIAYSKRGEIPESVRNALIEIAKKKQAMVDLQRQLDEKQKQVAAITAEQGRIRENMRTVDANGPYHNRLLAKLNDQETQIEKLQTDSDKLREQKDAAQKEYENYLSGLSVG